MGAILQIFGQLLVAVFSIIGKILGWVGSFIANIFGRVSSQRNETKLKEIIAIIHSALDVNKQKLTLVEQVLYALPANAEERPRVDKMRAICVDANTKLSDYANSLKQDMNGENVDITHLIRKYDEARRYATSMNYPITDEELLQLKKKYQGNAYFIDTLLTFTGVTNVQRLSDSQWKYRIPQFDCTLNYNDAKRLLTITALPDKSITFKENPRHPWVFSEDPKESIAFFNKDKVLEFRVKRYIDEVDHYDIAEIFHYMHRLVCKSEINPYAAKAQLTQMEAEDIEENVLPEIIGLQQTAPPPADYLPDAEKMHGGKQRWAQLADLQRVGMLEDKGFLIGKMGYGSYIYTGKYDSHILTIASVGSGKGVGVVIPNLLRHKGSAVVLDPKGENFIITAKKRMKMGNKVYYYDPWEVIDYYNKKNHGTLVPGAIKATINPLDFLDPDSPDLPDNARMLASSLILRTDQSGDFFYNGAENLIARLIVYICTMYPIGHECRTIELLRYLVVMSPSELHDRVLNSHLKAKEKGFKTHPMVIDLLKWMDDNLRSKARSFADIFSFAQQATEFLSNHRIADSFEKSNIDILQLKTQPTSLYLILDMDKLLFVSDNYKPLVRLIITTCMMGASVRSVASEKLLFMLDEIAQLGNLQYLPNLLSIYRSKGVVVWTIWQNIAQIQANYEKEWQTIIGNCDVQQYFGVNDKDTAELVSDAAGKTTIYKEAYNTSTSESRSESSSTSRSESYSSSTSEQTGTNSGSSYQGFNYSCSSGTSESHGTSNSYTDSFSFSQSIQFGTSKTSGKTLTKECVPLISPYDVTTGNAYDVQFVFYKNKCPYPILSGKIKYYKDFEFYGEFTKNVTIIK